MERMEREEKKSTAIRKVQEACKCLDEVYDVLEGVIDEDFEKNILDILHSIEYLEDDINELN